MAEPTSEITATPHDTNQIIVSENNGTIHVHNHLKQNDGIEHMYECLNNSFQQMERFFRENEIKVKKKRK